jgi:hypothetical protein
VGLEIRATLFGALPGFRGIAVRLRGYFGLPYF